MGACADEVRGCYFPGQDAASGRKRLARLTRTQLDIATQALLPGSSIAPASAALPRDPLQTNYEYADNLSWNDANFTPYTRWVREVAEQAATDPTRVSSHAAGRSSTSSTRARSR